jgi:hypothetical protein
VDYKEEIEKRIENRLGRSLLDANTQLEHFAIITYQIPLNKIQHLIPARFKLWSFKENEIEYALVSAVPFKDRDFSFHRISKYPSFNFFQTNFRTYIIDTTDQSPCAWFFGTTLGSLTSLIPKKVWKMPWEYGKYKFTSKFVDHLYVEYNMKFESILGNGIVNIKSTGNELGILKGFETKDEQDLILTHPVIGYYNLSEQELGTYEIWHPRIDLKEGVAIELYFELFEKLGFLTKEEMNKPHSVLITPKIEFEILLPPKRIKKVGNNG